MKMILNSRPAHFAGLFAVTSIYSVIVIGLLCLGALGSVAKLLGGKGSRDVAPSPKVDAMRQSPPVPARLVAAE